MKCLHMINIKNPKGNSSKDRILVPCGTCYSCSQNKRQDWVFRILEEYKVSKNSYFVTLTYDEEKIIYGSGNHGTLVKEHLQQFHKSLKQYQTRNSPDFPTLRYYSIGEYGTISNRPHYHALLFNVTNIIDINKLIQNMWPHGLIHIGKVEPKSVQYVTRHQLNKNRKYKGVEQPFAHMSRRPGLGTSYINPASIKYHKSLQKFEVLNHEKRFQNMPTFYKKKIFSEYAIKKRTAEMQIQGEANLIKEHKRIEKLGNNPYKYEIEQKKQYVERMDKKNKSIIGTKL